MVLCFPVASIANRLMERLAAQVRECGDLLVGESGLLSRANLDRAVEAGADAVRLGEALMRQDDGTKSLETLIGDRTSTG